MEIELTQGQKAFVDDKDYEKLSNFKWYAAKMENGFYAKRTFRKDGKKHNQYLHRTIMEAEKGVFVDHINGNTLDNRRENLRICTPQENSWNKIGKNAASSQFKGVGYEKDTKKWRARISVNGKEIHLGLFVSPIKAALAYDEAASEHFGEFARLNFKKEQ